MGWRAGMCVLAVTVAVPAFAATGDAGDGSGLEHQALAMSAIAPGGPILSSTEGADPSGGSNIFVGALWGGLAGAAIGTGVALIEGGNWGRDIGIGAGIGVIVGGVLGATNAFGDRRGPLPMTDGLASTDRDPVITARTVGYAGRF